MRASPVLVLVHGAGHTSLVWQATREHLRHGSVAVDLPGRRDRRGDITTVTIAAAAESIAIDVRDAAPGQVVLVGHSVGGIVLPGLAARLGPCVDRLVFVAGLSAPDGCVVADTVRPGHTEQFAVGLRDLRERYRNHMLAPDPLDGVGVIDDARDAMGIDSLNFMTQTVSWDGVPPALPRTFIRCTRDPIQPPELQAQLVSHCGASEVLDIDSGHTPALDAPRELAAMLDRIADGA